MQSGLELTAATLLLLTMLNWSQLQLHNATSDPSDVSSMSKILVSIFCPINYLSNFIDIYEVDSKWYIALFTRIPLCLVNVTFYISL